MSFEDLQQKWQRQFSAPAPAPAASHVEVELLEQILRQERRFRLVVFLLVTRSAVASLLYLRIFLTILHERIPPPSPEAAAHNRHLVHLGVILVIILTLASIRARPSLLPPVTERNARGPVQSWRLRRDGRRFDAMILWRDLREVVGGIALVVLAGLHASHVVHYPALVWIATALFAASTAMFLVHRLRTQARKPAADGTLLGTLAVSIHQTRTQVRLLDNIWWYLTPIALGALLMGPVQASLVHGFHRQNLAAVIAVPAAFWGVWRLNRWAARNRLHRRLEQLESMRSDLAGSLPPEPMA